MNIKLKFLCKSIFLFSFIFLGVITPSSAAEHGIFSLSEEPTIDTAVSDYIEITIDFTEEAKQQLTGNGTITVDIDSKDYINTNTKYFRDKIFRY